MKSITLSMKPSLWYFNVAIDAFFFIRFLTTCTPSTIAVFLLRWDPATSADAKSKIPSSGSVVVWALVLANVLAWLGKYHHSLVATVLSGLLTASLLPSDLCMLLFCFMTCANRLASPLNLSATYFAYCLCACPVHVQDLRNELARNVTTSNQVDYLAPYNR